MSEAFAGHDLETGILQRVRRWRDALPVLVLIDALRVAGSPLYVGCAGIAVWLTPVILGEWPAGRFETAEGFAGFVSAGDVAVVSLRSLAVCILWALPAALIARAGACYSAGRYQTFSDHAGVVGRRLPSVLAVPLLPVGLIAVLALIFVLQGVTSGFGAAGPWGSEAAAWVLLPAAIVAGILAAGAPIAAALAWAAVVVEKRCDVFDSVSRGYEYLYRRPVHLMFYSLAAAVLVAAAALVALAVSAAAATVIEAAYVVARRPAPVPFAYRFGLALLPSAVAAAAIWGQVGGIYLLMRQAAGGQEIEDVAVSPTDRREAELPSLSDV